MKTDLHSVDPKVVNMVLADEDNGSEHHQDEEVDMPNENGYLW